MKVHPTPTHTPLGFPRSPSVCGELPSQADSYQEAVVVAAVVLTCNRALAVYVTRMAGKVPSFMAFLNMSVDKNFPKLQC